MGLSFGEIIFILIIAFLVLGPDKLPEVGRALGKTVNSFKQALSNSELDFKDEVKEIKKQTGLSDLSQSIQEEEKKFKEELANLKKGSK